MTPESVREYRGRDCLPTSWRDGAGHPPLLRRPDQQRWLRRQGLRLRQRHLSTINLVCTHALMAGCAEQKQILDEQVLRQVIADLEVAT